MFFTELFIGLFSLGLYSWLIMHVLRFYKGVRIEDALEGEKSRLLKYAKILVPVTIVFLSLLLINIVARLVNLLINGS